MLNRQSAYGKQDPLDRGVYETLPGHQAPVSCVRFQTDDTFASADAKGVIRLWNKLDEQACSFMYLASAQ